MTLLADPSIREFPDGLALEIAWSKDESMTMLFITTGLGTDKEKSTKIEMTPLQLDWLRVFIMDNID